MVNKEKKVAVILIDMQDFFLQHFKENIRMTLVNNQLRLLDKCAEQKMPLIVIEYKARGKFRGSTTSKLDQKIKAIPHVLIIKESNSGFTNTALDKILQGSKIKRLFIMGINANACIQDTAIGAIHRGYQVIVSKGLTACSSRSDMEFSNRNDKWYRENCKLLNSLEESLRELDIS